MKFLLSKIVGVFLLIFTAATLSAQWAGSGTAADPYQIKVRADIETLSTNVSNGNYYSDSHFKLMNDIDMTTGLAPNADSIFIPIGSYANAFRGVFDGDSHIISNLYVNQPNEYYAGLFGKIAGGTLRNLGLIDVDITGKLYVGGFCGVNVDSSMIVNCYATGAVTGTKDYVGGFCGYNNYSSTIRDCYATGEVIGTDYAGGFCGYNDNSSTIVNCYATGAATGRDYVGGFSGYNNHYSTIANSYATGEVAGNNYAGAFCAYNYNNSTIENCYATGEFSGNYYAGGFCGYNIASSTIENCYATGVVTGAGDNVGGFCAYNYNSTIENCYATGVVTGAGNNVGGFCGFNNSRSTIANSYATGAVTGTSLCVGGFCGYNIASSTITNCYATGEVAGASRIGGFSGDNTGSSTIENCYATGAVTATNYYAGGFSGSNTGSSMVRDCYATGAVTGTRDYVGGFCGYNTGSCTIKNCYATGAVTGVSRIGGFCGENHNSSTVTNCYATGKVTGTLVVGGFCGNNYNSTVTNCYFDKDKSGETDALATGLTTVEMVLTQSFVDSLNSGSTVWAYGSPSVNLGYPVLKWQNVAPFTYGAVGQQVVVSADELSVDSKSKLVATYMPPLFMKQKEKKLSVKMVKKSDDTFEIKGKIRLVNNKAYKAALKAKMYTQEAITDTNVQAGFVTVDIRTKVKKELSDSACTLVMSPPLVYSVDVDTVMVKDKPVYYAIVFIYNAGAKPKGWLERGTVTEYQGKLSAAIQKKYAKLPPQIQSLVDEASFNDPEAGVFVFKLHKKYTPDAFERVDLVIDNQNGMDAMIFTAGSIQ